MKAIVNFAQTYVHNPFLDITADGWEIKRKINYKISVKLNRA